MVFAVEIGGEGKEEEERKEGRGDAETSASSRL